MSINEYLKQFTKMKEEVFFIGRLDYNASGLMLFTNSEELKGIVQQVSE